jgi:DNA-binding NarL/FixJ family response regulator
VVTTSNHTIIVVDDYKIVSEAVATRLAAEDDFDVLVTASTALEAKQWIDQHRPNVVLTDYILPDRTCLDLMKESQAIDSCFSPCTASISSLSAFSELVALATS